MIDPRRDYAGLRIAAAELFDEGFRRPEFCRIVERSQPEQLVAIMDRMMPQRTLASGYYLWIGYLCWLRLVMGLPGIQLAPNADEVEGLLVLQEAQRAFDATHTHCYRCGELNEKGNVCCSHCSAEFRK